MEPAGLLLILGIVVCAMVSFFFALAESALFALGKWRARQLNEFQGGRRVLQLLDNPSELLATIVLANTLANACIVALALWLAVLQQWGILATLAGVLFLLLTACEVLPKTLAVRSPQHWSLWVARPMIFTQKTTAWFQRLVQRLNNRLITLCIPKSIRPQSNVTDEDYQELVEMAFQQGTLAASEKEIILEIVSLDQKTATDVMKPRSQMAAIPDDLTVEEMVAAARDHGHSRLPIYDETPDTIVGILNTRKFLLDPEHDMENATEFPSFVPETMNLLQLLKSLQRQRRGLAIVMDEYGGTAGLVTTEDILEEVVGDIRDEHESREIQVEHLAPGKWRVDGMTRIDEFYRVCPQIGEVEDIDTLGGLLMARLEVVPQNGQSVVFRGLRLTAESADERRVHTVLVERIGRK